MGIPVVIAASGGLPVVVAATGGLPMTIATNGFGIRVTQSTSGFGLPVTGITFGPSIVLTGNTVLENSAVNTVIGALSMSGTTGTPAYTLTDSAGGRFKLVGSSLQVAAATLDYETATSHNITVSVTGVTPVVSAATFTIVVLNVTLSAPAAPSLVLTSGPTDTTPDFTLSGDLVVGDTVRFQYSAAPDFTSPTALTNTIDAAEDTANSINFTTGALAPGTWYFRARIERPEATNSDWSNTVTDTITAPSYTGPGNIVAGAVAWWGLRAYNAAAIGTAAIRVKRADAVEKDILIAANGIIDVADAHFNGSTPYQIVKFYDQTGNSKHTDVAVVAGTYPVLDLNDNGSLPTCRYIGTLETTNTIADLTQPTSIVAVARRTSYTSVATQIMQIGTAPHTLEFGVTANQVQLTIGAGSPTATATENVTHALGAVFNNTASKLGVDGTTTGSLNIGGSNSSGAGVGRFPGYGYQNNAKIWEGGFWPGDISASFAALSTNAHTVWNF